MPTAKVTFQGSSKRYSYTIPEGDWQTGDLIIVDAPSTGYTLTSLVEVEAAEYPGNKIAVGAVSLQGYRDHLTKLARKAEIVAQLDRAAAAQASLSKYAHLRNDPALAALVVELEQL